MSGPMMLARLCATLLLNVSLAYGATVPGTSVALTPPPGFVPASRFAGFADEGRGASIVVHEMPAPFAEFTAGFADEQRMRGQGMKLLTRQPIRVAGHPALLLHVEQTAQGLAFRKWVLAVDRPGMTAMLLGTYLANDARTGESLKAALLGTSFGAASDPVDALAFVVRPAAPLQIAKVMGQVLLLTQAGTAFPNRDERVPFMVVGSSLGQTAGAVDRRVFAERRAEQISTVRSVKLGSTAQIAVGGLSGYVTLGTGVGQGSGTLLAIYQVILFDDTGYYLVQGLAPADQADTWRPIFEQTTQSFRLKEARR